MALIGDAAAWCRKGLLNVVLCKIVDVGIVTLLASNSLQQPPPSSAANHQTSILPELQTYVTTAGMGTKRPHQSDFVPPESASRRTPIHPSKRRKPNDFPPSVNQLKSKIRDLTRALEHSDHLPAGVRIEKERALAGYKQDVEKIHEDKRKNELIKKYHMVRFFGGSFLALV